MVAAVAVFGDFHTFLRQSPFSATVAVFGAEIGDYSRQCGQAFTSICCGFVVPTSRTDASLRLWCWSQVATRSTASGFVTSRHFKMWICCTTYCTTNPQQIEVMEFGL